MDNGLDAVTTEAIAEAAGISTRTFFNYYPNKESAAIGSPPGFGADEKTTLIHGSGSLADDIKLFLDHHIAALAEHENILRQVRSIIRENPKAHDILNRVLMAERDELADCLANRVADRDVAMSLADSAMVCTDRTIRMWEQQDTMSLPAMFERVWAGQIAAASVLAQSNSQALGTGCSQSASVADL